MVFNYKKYFLFLLSIVCACFLFSSCKSRVENNISTNNFYWERTGPGGGGSTFIPTFSYYNANDFFVRCDMTGSYLTKDGGKSFTQKNFNASANCYTYDPNDSNIIYTGSAFLNQSKDGGKTWEQIFPKKSEIESEQFIGDHAEYKIQTTDNSLYINKVGKIEIIKVDPSQKKSIYFTMGSYFFYSNDNAETINRIDVNEHIDNIYTNNKSLNNEVYIFCADAFFVFNKSTKLIKQKNIPEAMLPANCYSAGTLKNADQTIFFALHYKTKKEDAYAFAQSEIWSSKDLGNTWQQIKDSIIINKKNKTKPSFSMITCAEYDAANAYVVCNNADEKIAGNKIIKWYGALKTNDAGASWHWVWKGGGGSGQYEVHDANDAANLNDAWAHNAFGKEFIQLLDAGVYPRDGNVAVITDWYRAMKTIDGGKTWNEIYSIKNNDSTFSSNGLDVTTCYGVHCDPFDSNHIAVSYTDIGFQHSYNNGKSWKRSVDGVPEDWVNTCYLVAFDPVVKNKVWSVWSGMHDIPRGKMTRNPQWKNSNVAKGGVCISTNGGKTWKPIIDGMGNNSPATSIVIDEKSPVNNRTLYATVYNKGVFKSVDDGKTWSLKNNGIDSNNCAFKITIASNGNLFLVVSPTPVYKDGKKVRAIYSGAVYRSTDGAVTWKKLNVINGFLFPNGIVTDSSNPRRIYLSCWSSIYLSDLIGAEFAKNSGGDSLINIPGGIFRSDDSGDNWVSIFDKKQYVYDVTIDPYKPGKLYCNTFNKAAYLSNDFGKNWKQIKGYDFQWGHRIIVDKNDHEKIYITTYGSGVWHGKPVTE